MATAFALEGDPRDYEPAAEILTFDVNVVPAAQPASRLRCSFPLPSRVTGALSSEHSMRHMSSYRCCSQPVGKVHFRVSAVLCGSAMRTDACAGDDDRFSAWWCEVADGTLPADPARHASCC